MKKRGIIIAVSGAAMFFAALALATSVVSNSPQDYDENTSVAKLFAGMFDSVSDETVIQPGTSGFFTFTTSKPGVPLFWGVQIIDFQDGDQFTVSISNIYGDSFGAFSQKGPMTFQILQTQKADTYNFQVENNGKRAISAIMMFTEDPDNSEAFNNPDSPISKIVIPILISGILFILGILLIIAGIIVIIYDWKKALLSRD